MGVEASWPWHGVECRKRCGVDRVYDGEQFRRCGVGRLYARQLMYRGVEAGE